MADGVSREHEQLSWRFPSTFWFANGAELCERAAYYGMFITLYRYLNIEVGFTDLQCGPITGAFAAGLYLFPTFMGIMADKIGFKQALMLAFALLTAGYAMLGSFQLKSTAILSLCLIMLGGAIIKPVISGTVAKCSDAVNRARAMSIFYMVVNIGSFTGKGLAGYLNETLGLQYINYYAAGMSFVALVLVTVFYRNVDTAGVGKSVGEALRGLGRVLLNFRFITLIFIVAGFWLIQGQLYGAMPSYVERVLGEGYMIEWLANINPLTVVIFVVPITHLVRRFKSENAIAIGLAIIPFTAIVIAWGTTMQASGGAFKIAGLTMHPLILMIILGVGLQGLAECFLSPKFLEYASKQAPEGEVGLYLGFSHLHTVVAWGIGMVAAGVLLNTFCPDPRTLEPDTRHAWRLATNTEYRFTLPEGARGELGDGDAVGPALHAAFAEYDLPLDAAAQVAELETRDGWRSDPEREWEIYWTLFRISQPDEGAPLAVSATRTAPAPGQPGRFELPADLRAQLADGGVVSESVAAAFADQGVMLPVLATIRAASPQTIPTPEDEAAAGEWEVLVRYRVEEQKLESTSDALADEREHAHRDVIVLTDRARDNTHMPLPSEYKNARYVWFAFTLVGVAAFVAMLIFKFVTDAIDRKHARAAGDQSA